MNRAFVVFGIVLVAAALSVPSVYAWQLIEVGPDERSVEIEFNTGGCEGPGGSAQVVESPLAVGISLAPHRSSAGLNCVSILYDNRLIVPLAAPLEGRHVQGGSLPYSDAPWDQRTPRLIGLSPSDAQFLLSGRHLRTTLRPVGRTRGLAHVASQTPAPGASYPQNRIVHLGVFVNPG